MTNEEFWGKFGFKQVTVHQMDGEGYSDDLHWVCGDWNSYTLPEPTLDNLFLYCMPILPNYIVSFYPTKVNPTDSFTTWYVMVGLFGGIQYHKEDKDPAIALKKAIEEIL